MANIPKMNGYRLLYVHLPQRGAKFFCQPDSILIGPAGSAKAGHGDAPNTRSVQSQPVEGPHCHQKCQCGIQSAGKADDGIFAASVPEPFGKSVCLDIQNLIAALFPMPLCGRYEGRSVIMPCQLRNLPGPHKKFSNLIPIFSWICHKGKGRHPASLAAQTVQIDLRNDIMVLCEGLALRQDHPVFHYKVVSRIYHILCRFTLTGIGV